MIRRLWTSLIFFELGAAALLGQMILLREFLVIAEGNELCLSYYFFFWFAGVSLGAASGGRSAGVQRPQWWLVFWMTAVALLLWMQLGVVRNLRYLFEVPAGEFFPLHTFLLGALLGVFPFSFVIGLLFPFAGRVVESPQAAAAHGYSLLYIVDAVGCLFAGFLFSFWLATQWSHPLIIKGAAVALTSTGFVFLLVNGFGKTGPDRLRVWSIGMAVLFFILFPADRFEQGSQSARWRIQYPGLQPVEIRNTPYGRLDLGRLQNQYNLFVNGAFAVSFPDEYSALEPVHCAMVQSPSPEKVLMIGGGLDAALIILDYPIRQLDWVELDPEVIQLQMQYHESGRESLAVESRVNIHYNDGRLFLQETSEKFDLILLDVPSPSTVQMNRYYTREFFQAITERLSARGAVALSIQATVLPDGEEVRHLSQTLYLTLQSVFEDIIVRPGQSYWFYCAKQKGVVTSHPWEMTARYKRAGVEPAEFALLFPGFFQPDRVERLLASLSERPSLRINTDRHPFALGHQLAFFFQFAEGGWKSVIGALSAMAVVVLLVLLELQPFLGRKRKSVTNVFWTAAIIGHAGMTIELVLLILFQNRFGVLYEEAAVLVGLFMFGAAAGAFGVRRLMIGRKMQPLSVQRLLEKIFLLFIAFSIVLLGWILFEDRILQPSIWLYSVFVMVDGVLTGAVFPACLFYYMSTEIVPARAAGRIDASDHLGAMVASLLVYPLLLPVLGAVYILVLEGALLALVYVRLLWTRKAEGPR